MRVEIILRRRWDKGKYMKPLSKNQERRPLGVDPEYTLLDSMVNQENKIYFWYSEMHELTNSIEGSNSL